MATSILPARYKTNGILDTKVPVMTNLETLCNSCGSFMSYDIHTGLWSVVINTTGASVKSFSNANIIGPIQVSGTSLQNLFNRVRVEFPLRDTSDGIDFIEIEIPVIDRYPNEPDNTLQMTLQMCNEPVQATIIGLIELKQSRIDQIITFISDYSTLSLNAGDIIDVTNDIYQFTAKPFRIISIRELDTESGSIQIEITALAYDANVYSTADLGRFIRTDRNGIVGIGSISAPITPVLYNYAQDSRPGIVIETVVPAGIVESMEFWVSTDNTNFISVGSQMPVGGGTFDSGDVVTFDYDQVASANYFAKTRGMNSTTAGPFSPVVSIIGFVPVQVTDAVTQDAPLVQNGTGNLLTALALSKIAGWAFSSVGPSTFGNVMTATGQVANSFTRDSGSSATTTVTISSYTFSAAATNSGINTVAGTATLAGFAGTGSTALTFPLTVPYSGSALIVLLESCYGTWNYQVVDAVTGADVIQSALAYYPMLVQVYKGATKIKEGTVDWQTQSTQFLITPSEVSGGSFAGNWSVKYNPLPTYDLNMNNPNYAQPVIFCYNMSASRSTVVTFQLIQ